MRNRYIFGSIVVIALFAAISSSQIRSVEANPLANWTPEFNLSDWQEGIYDYRLKLGTDGTLAAFWVKRNSAKTQWSLWSRVRQPGADWTPPVNLSGPQMPLVTEPTHWDADVAPSGTAWALWVIEDHNIVGNRYFVRAANRPPGGPWQSAHPSPLPAPAIPEAKLVISPDGHLVAAWIECKFENMTNNAPCAVKVAIRYPGASAWESVERIDDGWTNTNMDQVQPLVANGGFAVVLWQAENDTNPGEYGLKSRAFDPGSGAWSPPNNTPPFSGWTRFMHTVESVMGADGTVVAAWISEAAGSSNYAVHSATRTATSGTWGPVAQISSSGIYPAGYIALAVGQDGTAVAAWRNKNLLGNYPIYASARDPGSTWDIETLLSGSQYDDYRLDVGVWPNGEALVVWGGDDTNQPDPSDSRISWSFRPPNNNWGIAQGNLGVLVDFISGLDLALGDDGSAALVWSVQESSGFYSVQAANWPPGGPWDAPSPLASQYSATFMYSEGLAMGREGQPVAAAWTAWGNVGSFEAVSFSEQIFPPPTDGGNLYLPLVVKGP